MDAWYRAGWSVPTQSAHTPGAEPAAEEQRSELDVSCGKPPHLSVSFADANLVPVPVPCRDGCVTASGATIVTIMPIKRGFVHDTD
jgi:hypothetical protein